MGEALGVVLPLAVAVAVFPIPVIAVVLMVGSDRGRARGLAFVLAWCVGLSLVGVIALALAEGADASEDDEPATWVAVLLLVLGLLLLAAAAGKWRARPEPVDEAPMPAWMRTIDTFTATRAGAAGFALSALNPKNALLVVAAVVEIAAVGLPAHQEITVLLVWVLIASLGVLTPLVLAVAAGDRAQAPLSRLRGWMARHSPAIMAALFLVIGAKLIGDALVVLSS